MSIYRRPRWIDPNGVHHVPVEPTATTPNGARSSAAAGGASSEPQDWSKVRKAQPAEHLLAASEDWLDSLPPEVFPGALATYFPRIVNQIARQWSDRRECSAYFSELLVDRRGGRQGFPVPVKRDLQRLVRYWFDGRPGLQE